MRLAFCTPVLLLLGAAPTAPEADGRPKSVEIVWDRYGVPHIFADERDGAMRALGYAQMANHAEQMLLNIASARGRYAAYFGAGPNDRNVESDIDVVTNDIPGRAARWLRSGGAEQQRMLRAFADGANEWARRNRATLDPAIARVLPVRPDDPLALYQLTTHYSFMGARAYANAAAWKQGGSVAGWAAGTFGSNAFAIMPKRSRSGNTVLVGNPHVDLGGVGPQSGDGFPVARQGLFQWMEANLVVGPRDRPSTNFTGVGFVGSPVLAIGFNDHLGWSHTVNAAQNADVYDLTLKGDTYLYGGRQRKLDQRPAHVTVCDFGGTGCRDQTFTIASSVHGPIIARRADHHALALRIAGLDTDRALLQYWRMANATDLRAFERAFAMLEMPYFNVVYGDRDGHVLYADAGRRPRRNGGDYDSYRGVLNGSDPRAFWSATVPWNRLPRVVDPAGGFIQNANDSPWTSTFPAALHRKNFPRWLSFDLMDLRPQQAASGLIGGPLTVDDLIRLKQSTRMILADRWLPDLRAIVDRSGDGDLRSAMAVLERWDRRADAESRGAVLFDRFRVRYVDSTAPTPNSTPTTPPALFRLPYDPANPLVTPTGIGRPDRALAALRQAVADLRGWKRPLDVAWGDVHRVVLTQRDGSFRNPRIVGEGPASGSMDAYGGLRLVKYGPRAPSGVAQAVAGEGWVQVVEFRPEGAVARTLLVYGNASRPGSSHTADQLPLFIGRKLRPSWRTRSEILAHAERRETL